MPLPYLEDLNSILTWYQNHVGAYDKAKWEQTVEERILNGINHIPKKSAKLQSELIDLDLVRGSSFPKAKPKHGLFTVARQALLRFFFLPYFYKWWSTQTSHSLFVAFLFLYTLQGINVFLYFNIPGPQVENVMLQEATMVLASPTIGTPTVQLSEILSPLVLMIVLTILHSQIVATHSFGYDALRASTKDKGRRGSRRASGAGWAKRTKRKRKGEVRRRSSLLQDPPRGKEEINGPNQTGMKKVLFEDESKSISSNSDKDEGIAEEIMAEENPQEKTVISNKGNLTTLKEMLVMDEECEEDKPPYSFQKDDVKVRRRNMSKASEASGSCGECSSNGNVSTSEDEDFRVKSEWTAVTTNSEDDDYEVAILNSEDEEDEDERDHPFAWEFGKDSGKEGSPSSVSSHRISCTIWEGGEAKKADLTVLDISSMIIGRVECARENSDYLYLGISFSALLAILPCIWRINSSYDPDDFEFSKICNRIFDFIYADDIIERGMVMISMVERFVLALFLFFLLAVAEKTYKQRFLYAKLFSRITSSRKARKSEIPHFRLNKVGNIKTWLSVRSYLQRRGPQRSVDIIVSSTFIANLILIFFLSVELLKDSNRMYFLYNVDVIAWTLCLGIFLMRFMTLGSRISQKYRNVSVIITEQLNLYLKMEQKPHKKDELLVANNVLKLAAELLKVSALSLMAYYLDTVLLSPPTQELDDPFKISSFASNPYLYNVTRLVILSAFSGVLSEMLGFKLKLYKIKIK